MPVGASPIFAAVSRECKWALRTPALINGTRLTRNVLFALQAYTEGGVSYYRPRCYPLDPYMWSLGRQVGQVGIDLWEENTGTIFTTATNGLPR